MVILAINIPFFFIGPQEIVEYLGIGNTVVALFIISVLAGVSSFGGAVWFSSLLGFSVGGAHPLLLGIVSGLGIFISDTFFYHMALYGKRSLPNTLRSKIQKILEFIHITPDWIILGLAFIYLGLTLFPADILMLILALSGYRYRKIFPVLLLGSISISLLVSYFGRALFF